MKNILLRIPPDLAEQLRIAAVCDDRSVNSLLIRLIKAHLTQQKLM